LKGAKLVANLPNLSPRRLEKLLHDCRNVKVKRLFFYFADRHKHAWLKHLDKESVDSPNFVESLHKPYSWEAAFSFLDGLEETERSAAFDYIRRAPEEVRTPFRAEFDKRHPASQGS
jgi:hypothetical protein